MNLSSFFISSRVINTINALPEEERLSIASAIAGEMLLGASVANKLSPEQLMIYTIIKDYIRRDSFRVTGA